MKSFELADLLVAYPPKELKDAGVSCQDMKDQGGAPIEQLEQAGYKLSDFIEAGFSPQEIRRAVLSKREQDSLKHYKDMKDNQKFTPQKFKAIGVRADELRQDYRGLVWGLPWTWTTTDLRAAGYDAPWICPTASDAEHKFTKGSTCESCGAEQQVFPLSTAFSTPSLTPLSHHD
eukprot:6338235-Prymnesium_polylepis.1